MRSTLPLSVLATSALLFTLVGCGAASNGDELTYEDSPLGEYLSAAWGGDLSQEEQTRQFEEQQAQAEELVAKCMSDEGFEYTPTNSTGGVISDGGEWEPDKREWVEKYGFGYVNSPFSDFSDEELSEQEASNPNDDYVASLSESEQNAYYEVLFGASISQEEPAEDGELDEEAYEYNWEDAGCQGWAQNEVLGDSPIQSEEFTALREKIGELYTKGQDAPELADLNAEWASCMAEKGEPGFSSPEDASQSILDAQDKIYEALPSEGAESGEIADESDPSASPEMEELAAREIELALIDLDCREKTSYTQKSLEIQFAIEEKFISENKAELDAFKAAAEQSE